MLLDLQLHSTYSDGYLSPSELASFINKQGIKVASLTDHNTVSGLYEFRQACIKYKIKTIIGIEIYVKLNNHKFNILWYNFDDSSPLLHNMLRESQRRRRQQMRNILKRMKSSGFKLNPDAIIDKYNHYVPINHVIDDVISVPQNMQKIKNQLRLKTVREEDIISEYFHNKKIKPILRNSYIDIRRIMHLKKKIGGQIILCHPAKHHYINKKNWLKLKKIGLDGVETLSPHHSYGAVIYIQHLARELNLLETGGSDFHRPEGNNFLVQKSWDYFSINSKYLKGIKKIIS